MIPAWFQDDHKVHQKSPQEQASKETHEYIAPWKDAPMEGMNFDVFICQDTMGRGCACIPQLETTVRVEFITTTSPPSFSSSSLSRPV